MDCKIYTEQILALQPKAKEWLSQDRMSDEMLKAYKAELVKRETYLVHTIMDNLPDILEEPVQRFADWLDKVRLLRNGMIWVEQEQDRRAAEHADAGLAEFEKSRLAAVEKAKQEERQT